MTEQREAPATAPRLPERSYADVLSGIIRFKLAGVERTMPVLTKGQNREWLAKLEVAFAPIIEDAEGETTEQVVEKLVAVDDRLLDFVYEYDLMHVLPERGAWEDDIYPHEVIRAVMEVRVAANPTLGYALAGVAEDMAEQRAIKEVMETVRSSQTTNSQRRRTAGRAKKSIN